MEINGETDTTAPFRHVMRRVTEQAVQYGLEENVMEALFDVLDAAAQARDTPGPAGDDVFVQPERSAG